MKQEEGAVPDRPVKELRHAAFAEIPDGGAGLALAEQLVV
jgi:hypothetical protein